MHRFSPIKFCHQRNQFSAAADDGRLRRDERKSTKDLHAVGFEVGISSDPVGRVNQGKDDLHNACRVVPIQGPPLWLDECAEQFPDADVPGFQRYKLQISDRIY